MITISKVPAWAKFASKAVQVYRSCSPVERGKHWLLRRCSSFLVAPVGSGLWMRATGVSGFEWKALNGRPGEESTAALFVRLLRPGMTVFDVGSNVGYYSLLAAKAVGATGHVHAFEATPEVARRLEENVAINGLKNVSVNNLAVCDRLGEVEFRLQDEDSEGNSMVSFGEAWSSVRVPATTLDHYLYERGIERVDVIKIDVEGAEELVIDGASGLLSRGQPPVLILEANVSALRDAGSSVEVVCGKLANHGYRCLEIEQLLPEPCPVWNLVAIHRSHQVGPDTARLQSFVPKGL